MQPLTSGVFTIYLYPCGHTVMQKAAEHHLWTQEGGFQHSTARRDKAYSLNVPLMEPIEVQLDADQVLIFDGRLPHSGAGGKRRRDPASGNIVTDPNLRLHWYIAPRGWVPPATEELDQEDQLTTAPLHALHPDMHSKELSRRFLDLSGQVVADSDEEEDDDDEESAGEEDAGEEDGGGGGNGSDDDGEGGESGGGEGASGVDKRGGADDDSSGGAGMEGQARQGEGEEADGAEGVDVSGGRRTTEVCYHNLLPLTARALDVLDDTKASMSDEMVFWLLR
jgi:hypothetical protein